MSAVSTGVEMGRLVESHETILAKLAIADDACYETLLAGESSNVAESHLDDKMHALVRIGGLVAVDAASPGYMWTVELARRRAHPTTRSSAV